MGGAGGPLNCVPLLGFSYQWSFTNNYRFIRQDNGYLKVVTVLIEMENFIENPQFNTGNIYWVILIRD